MRLKHQLIYWLPVFPLRWPIFIFRQCLLPAVGHAAEYAVLSFLLFRAIANAESPALKMNAYVFAITFVILFGTNDELHQFFVPGRDCSGVDLIFDGIGSSLILLRELFKR